MKGKNIPFKKNMIQATAIVLAALVLGIFLVQAVRTLKSYDDTVSVRGLCEREVPADRVVYRITYSEKSNSFTELRSLILQNNSLIVKKLQEAGLDKEAIKVGNTSYEDRYNYSYNDPSRIAFRYTASQTISVFTTSLDLVRKLQETLEADLAAQNILASTSADYQFLGLNDIKPSMIAESLDNARTAADEFARNSHSRIGKMHTASQGYFEVNDLDENTPQVKKVRVVTSVTYYLK
ncbi:MAG: SIMPL domain-containing protein [Bacteroidales bacterium]|nr:SIMPL domain-containing protein [Bacteroidales bacterium]